MSRTGSTTTSRVQSMITSCSVDRSMADSSLSREPSAGSATLEHRRVSLPRCPGLVTVSHRCGRCWPTVSCGIREGRTLVDNQFRFGVFLRPDPKTCAAVTQITSQLRAQYGLVSAGAFPPHITLAGSLPSLFR